MYRITKPKKILTNNETVQYNDKEMKKKKLTIEEEIIMNWRIQQRKNILMLKNWEKKSTEIKTFFRNFPGTWTEFWVVFYYINRKYYLIQEDEIFYSRCFDECKRKDLTKTCVDYMDNFVFLEQNKLEQSNKWCWKLLFSFLYGKKMSSI